MAFADEFVKLFAEVFGVGKIKPRIRSAGHGLWACAFGNGAKGYGKTPADAYEAWRYRMTMGD